MGASCALSEIFNTKKPRSRVSSKECQFLLVKQRISVSEAPFFKGVMGNVCDSSLARWKVDSNISIGYN